MERSKSEEAEHFGESKNSVFRGYLNLVFLVSFISRNVFILKCNCLSIPSQALSHPLSLFNYQRTKIKKAPGGLISTLQPPNPVP